jgi:hypothetical protein
MRREFAATLRNMGRFARVIGEDHRDGPQIATLRETINSGFSSTHTNADSVKFEFGAERQADLAERDSILRWATEARTAYLLELSLGRGLEYQTRSHPLTLSLVEARRTFCRSTGQALENLAAGVEGGTVTEKPDLPGALGGFETEFANWFAANPEQHMTGATSGILATARQFVAVVEGIAVDIEEHASERSNALRRATGRKGQEGTSAGTSGEC